MAFWNRKYKDSVFTDLFGSDRDGKKFYRKDNSKLELIVKVKNCSGPKLLPIVKKCDILKQYCQFIEIVEQNYKRLIPKKSFKKAIEDALTLIKKIQCCSGNCGKGYGCAAGESSGTRGTNKVIKKRTDFEKNKICPFFYCF